MTDKEIIEKIKGILETQWSKLENRNAVRGDETELVDKFEFTSTIIVEFNLMDLREDDPELYSRIVNIWKSMQASSEYFQITSGGFILPL